jgi:hypothetical protein
MSDALPNGDEIIDSIKNVAGLILGVSEKPQRANLPSRISAGYCLHQHESLMRMF